MNADELVENILTSVQWDCWRFPIPYAKPLLKLDVAVVSHGHEDHWHPNFWRKDLVLIAKNSNVPASFSGLRNVMEVGSAPLSLGKLRLACFNTAVITRFIGQPIPRLHAYWWVASAKSVKVLFIGNLNLADVKAARLFIEATEARAQPFNAILLPSYGAVSNHGATQPTDLFRSVELLARWLYSEKDVVPIALPHPVMANWSRFNAVKV